MFTIIVDVFDATTTPIHTNIAIITISIAYFMLNIPIIIDDIMSVNTANIIAEVIPNCVVKYIINITNGVDITVPRQDTIYGFSDLIFDTTEHIPAILGHTTKNANAIDVII